MPAIEARRQVNFTVDPKVYDNLRRRAQAMGNMAVSTYARLLFEAAYAARVGREKGSPTSDQEFDEQVRAVFCMAGDFKPDAIAKALGVSRAFVNRVIKAWGIVAKERA